MHDQQHQTSIWTKCFEMFTSDAMISRLLCSPVYCTIRYEHLDIVKEHWRTCELSGRNVLLTHTFSRNFWDKDKNMTMEIYASLTSAPERRTIPLVSQRFQRHTNKSWVEPLSTMLGIFSLCAVWLLVFTRSFVYAETLSVGIMTSRETDDSSTFPDLYEASVSELQVRMKWYNHSTCWLESLGWSRCWTIYECWSY